MITLTPIISNWVFCSFAAPLGNLCTPPMHQWKRVQQPIPSDYQHCAKPLRCLALKFCKCKIWKPHKSAPALICFLWIQNVTPNIDIIPNFRLEILWETSAPKQKCIPILLIIMFKDLQQIDEIGPLPNNPNPDNRSLSWVGWLQGWESVGGYIGPHCKSSQSRRRKLQHFSCTLFWLWPLH